MQELIRLNEVYVNRPVFPGDSQFCLPRYGVIREIWIHARTLKKRRSGKIIDHISLRVNGMDIIVAGEGVFLRDMARFCDPAFNAYVKYRYGIYWINFVGCDLDTRGIADLSLNLKICNPGFVSIYIRQ